jgi:invasion protein IalB
VAGSNLGIASVILASWAEKMKTRIMIAGIAAVVLVCFGAAAVAGLFYGMKMNSAYEGNVKGDAILAQAQPQQQVAQTQAPQAARPRRSESIVYDNWTVSCVETGVPGSRRTCSATLQLLDQNRKNVILQWFIARDEKGALFSVLHTPTVVQIQKGVELKVGNSSVRKINYLSCDNQKCESSMPVDDAFAKDFGSAQEAVVVIYAANGQGLSFNIPLKGADMVIKSVK